MNNLSKLREAENLHNSRDYHAALGILKSLEDALETENESDLHHQLMLKILKTYQRMRTLEETGEEKLELGLLYLGFQETDKANHIFISQIHFLESLIENHGEIYIDDLARVFNSLGHYYYMSNSALAISFFKKEILLNPHSINALTASSELLFRAGNIKAAINNIKAAIQELKEQSSSSDLLNYCFNNLIMMLHYDRDVSLEEIYLSSQQYYQDCILPFKTKFLNIISNTSCTQNQKTRIGFVSADLRKHALFYWLKDFLKDSNFTRSEIFLYHNEYEDSCSEIFKSQVENWRNISQLDDFQVYNLIKNDRIDILIDLSGHTDGNRLKVFSLKAAPTQITWLGQAGPMGLPEIDYILVGEGMIEKEEEKFYNEKIIRLPGFLAPYSFRNNKIIQNLNSEIPYFRNRYISFGSANNMIKIDTLVLKTWSEILHKVPNSRLLLKNQSLSDSSTRENICDFFSKEGHEQSRIITEGFDDRSTYLNFYNKIDIALDPFPVGGGTTSLDTLSMGVPILTLYGKQMSHRGTASLNKTLGLEQLITYNLEGYINKAVELANNPELIQNLKDTILRDFRNSKICDMNSFVNSFENKLKQRNSTCKIIVL